MSLLSFLSFFTSAQNPAWVWAKSAIGVGSDYSHNVALDKSGNVYVLGNFSSPLITFNTINLTKISYGNDIFIVKYDNNGNVLWAKNAGVPESNNNLSYCRGESMTVDENGNCIITGIFYGDSIIFDKTPLKNSADNNYNVFVVKYNTNGEVVWADCAKNTTYASGKSISSDKNGNLYLTGYFVTDSISFGDILLEGTVTSTADHGGIFLVKYDPAGNVVWAHSFGKTPSDESNSIGVDTLGNSYICGYLQGPSISFDTVTLTNEAFLGGIFIVKYNSDGNVVWAKTAEETGWGGAHCYSICVDKNGNFYLTGSFKSEIITFGSTILTHTIPAYESDPFFVKFDSDGNALWIKTAGAPYITGDKMIGLDDYGNSYITSNNIDDRVGLVDKFDASGNMIWFARAYWGMSGSGICVDVTGNSYVTGYFTSAQSFFGSIILNNAVTNGYSEEFFIAKLSNLVTRISEYNSSHCLINLYPSSSSDKITIENAIVSGNGIIYIFSSNGQLLLNKPLPGGKTDLDISTLANGIYLVRIVAGKEVIFKKFIKSKG